MPGAPQGADFNAARCVLGGAFSGPSERHAGLGCALFSASPAVKTSRTRAINVLVQKTIAIASLYQ